MRGAWWHDLAYGFSPMWFRGSGSFAPRCDCMCVAQ